MGSVNPVFLLPGAVAERAEKIAEGYVQSVTLGTGQFCTSPGIVLGERGAGLDRFLAATAAAASKVTPTAMLHAGIHTAYEAGVSRIMGLPGVEVAASSRAEGDAERCEAACKIFIADFEVWAHRPELQEEVFGPSSVVLRCASVEQMYTAARSLTGGLTATIHGTEGELGEHAELVRILERKVGRIVYNGFPTGLEPCAALHHGGPYPATTNSQYTSVGTAAIYRFVRPICYQGFPESALRAELQDANPRGVTRLVDGGIV
jgi:NADP-dependent aldehyde dehydrogenase